MMTDTVSQGKGDAMGRMTTQQHESLRAMCVASLLALMLMQSLCQGAHISLRRRNDSKKKDVSKEELRESLNDFSEFFLGETKRASTRLDELIPTTRTHKMTLMWRLRASQVLFATLSQDDAIAAYVDTWTLCIRLAQFFERGNGREAFGPHQTIVTESSATLVREAEKIGRSFLDDAIFDKTKTYVENLASKNPIYSVYSFRVIFASKQSVGGRNPLSDVLALPMAPFRALKGVDRGAMAMHKFNDSANRLTDAVELLPDSIRWQLLLLVFEMEETDLVRTVLKNLDQVSDSSSRLAGVAEALPEEMRKQASLLLDEVDEKQATLQVTLQRAEQTAAVVESAAATIDQSAQSVTETAQAWKATVVAIRETAKAFEKDKPKAAAPAEPFDIQEYKATLEAATGTAEELRALAVEIRQTIESQHLGNRIDDVNETATGIVRLTAVEAKMLIDRVARCLIWVSAIIFTFIFALALVYRFCTSRMTARA